MSVTVSKQTSIFIHVKLEILTHLNYSWKCFGSIQVIYISVLYVLFVMLWKEVIALGKDYSKHLCNI